MHAGSVASPVRLVVQMGTRGCPGALEEAIRSTFQPVMVLVPCEPRLAGRVLAGADDSEGLREVTTILARNAGRRALQQAAAREGQLTGVFDKDADPGDRIRVTILDPPLEEGLTDHLHQDVEACHVARDALDVLQEAGVALGALLEEAGIELATR